MNAPRALTSTHLSHLTVATRSQTLGTSTSQPYDLFIAAPHFTGDGTTLHASTHELLLLLSKPAELESLLASVLPRAVECLPVALESRLAHAQSAFQRAAHAVDYQLSQVRQIGGHTLPRAQRGARKTVIREVSFDEGRTKRVLQRCKEEGVSVSNAMFALTAIAWARTTGKPAPDLPM